MDSNTQRLLMGAAGAAGGLGIEEIFSTWLYTGNDSTQTITNGIDLSGEGGLVWVKPRNYAYPHYLYDSERSLTYHLVSSSTNGNSTDADDSMDSFNSNGFTISGGANLNASFVNYASWTFRKAPGFFDVVTYTGDGAATKNVAHSLGSAPGCIIVKNTAGGNWFVYHRSPGSGQLLYLNATNAQSATTVWGSGPGVSTFTVSGLLNTNNDTYVAYLFAHDEAIFGEAGDQSVIKCGSYTGTDSYQEINLGWEAQWVLIKKVTNNNAALRNWHVFDTMRGATVDGVTYFLNPNTSDTASGFTEGSGPAAVGFNVNSGDNFNASGESYIYIAIRRGPMKTPTSGTEVFYPLARTGTGSTTSVTGAGFPPDAHWSSIRTSDNGAQKMFFDRLRGANRYLIPLNTDAEGTSNNILNSFDQDGVTYGAGNNANGLGTNYINWMFRRAPGFFDVVAYTGTGVAHGEAHNLNAIPELIIWKERSTTSNWYVYQGFTARTYGRLNLSNAFAGNSPGWFSSVTSTHINVCASSDNTDVNDSGVTYIAYLFATLPGISKVGSYTGTATTQQINCGFTSGARFVLIKRTDSTGNWYIWDSARGIVSGNDPYLLLNSTAAEVTSTDYIDPLSSGFEISSTAPAEINASGGSYIFLAVA